MRAPVLAALAALLVLPVAAWSLPEPPPAPAAATPPQDAVELSHGFWTPYMHLAALDIPRGIRPGAWLQIGAANCTAAFVVQDPAGALYITTAGHCTEHVGQRVSVKEGVLVAALGDMVPFGTVVARWPAGLDAALVRIDEDKYPQVNPRMTGWGGPTGLATANPGTASVVKHYGWGWVTWYDFSTRCRAGVFNSWQANTWWYAGIGGGGDSGSAVMTADGKALGILDWGGGIIVPTPTGAFLSTMEGGVRFDRVLQAWANEGRDLSLVLGGPVNEVCTPEPPVP